MSRALGWHLLGCFSQSKKPISQMRHLRSGSIRPSGEVGTCGQGLEGCVGVLIPTFRHPPSGEVLTCPTYRHVHSAVLHGVLRPLATASHSRLLCLDPRHSCHLGHPPFSPLKHLRRPRTNLLLCRVLPGPPLPSLFPLSLQPHGGPPLKALISPNSDCLCLSLSRQNGGSFGWGHIWFPQCPGAGPGGWASASLAPKSDPQPPSARPPERACPRGPPLLTITVSTSAAGGSCILELSHGD